MGSAYASFQEVLYPIAEILSPREDISVLETAKRYVKDWDAELAHVLHEPMEELTSREYEAEIYVGPSRTSKTKSLLDCALVHNILVDPVDAAVFMPTADLTSFYSKKRFDIEIMNNVEGLRDKIRPGTASDTTYTKIFKTETVLIFGWTSKSQVASRDFVRVYVSDYDRITGDVGGEGNYFELLLNRTETYQSRGFGLCESSPGKPITNPKWKATKQHEAPPTTGILSLYNTGTRAMLYGQCPHCQSYFSPAFGPEAAVIPEEGSNFERAESASLRCTDCGHEIGQEYEKAFKRSAKWVHSGERIHPDGTKTGERIKSKRVSYWQSGWFAGFRPWEKLVSRYLDALQAYEENGDEGALQAVYNTGFAAPYLEMAYRDEGGFAEALQEKAVGETERYYVPKKVRTLIASVDVQAGKRKGFVVSVIGRAPGNEKYLVDRFDISFREDEDGNKIRLDPATRIEDWDYITEKVVNATYKVDDGREMRVFRTAIDSGGAAGVTERAYEYWRGLRKQNLHKRVRLVKGGNNPTAPIVKESWPDSTDRKDRISGGRGDVPVLILNTNLCKDAVHAGLKRETPGPSYMHFPSWTPNKVFQELSAEIRDDNGKWEVVGSAPNEQTDLCAYEHALWFWIGGLKMKWDRPKSWAMDWDNNTEVMTAEDRRELKKKKRIVRRRVKFSFNG